MTRYTMSFVIFVSFIIIGGNIIYYQPTPQEVNAQHHGAPPPVATIGERKLISKDGKHILSDFFHDHSGEVKLMFKDKRGSSSSHTIGGNQDVLTNAWIADPGSSITISGPVFNQSGTYDVDLELTTIDNDKTDLVEPLHYPVDINVS